MTSKIHRFKPWLVLACLILPATKLTAQAPTIEIKAELRVAAAEIVAEHHTLWLRTGPSSKAVKIPLNTRSFSEMISYKGPVQAQFFATQEAAESDQPVESPLALTALSAGESLLLFLPDVNGFSYRLLSTRGTDFPFGSFKFMNFSKAQIAIQAGEQSKPVTINPNEDHVFSFKQEEFFSIKVAAKFPDEAPHLIRQTKFSIGPDWREMVLLYNRPGEERVRMLHFVDTRPASKQEP